MFDWKKFSEEMANFYNLEMGNLEAKYQQVMQLQTNSSRSHAHMLI